MKNLELAVILMVHGTFLLSFGNAEELECNECISKFDQNGGCDCFHDKDCDHKTLVPEGCFHCGKQGGKYCINKLQCSREWKDYEDMYDDPEKGSTDSCMVNGANTNNIVQFHSGCFIPQINGPRCISECARFCSESFSDESINSCKGFSLGKVNQNSTEKGCVLAMGISDCAKLNVPSDPKRYGGRVEIFGNGPFDGFKTDTLYQGDLIESSNTVPIDFGFSGCYKKVNEPDCEDDFWCKFDYLLNDPDCDEAHTWDNCPKSCGECSDD